MATMRRLLCRLFGHRKVWHFAGTARTTTDPTPIIPGCGRCGKYPIQWWEK